MYTKRVFKKITRDASFSPQKEIFSTFYQRGSSSNRSEFGQVSNKNAGSESSYLKFKPSNKSDVEGTDVNDNQRQTLNVTKNYERVSKFSRYEYVANSNSSQQNMMPGLGSPQAKNEILLQQQNKPNPIDQKQGLNYQFQTNSAGAKPSIYQSYQQNRNTVQVSSEPLLSEQKNIVNQNQVQQQQKLSQQKLEKPPSDKYYTQIDLAKEMEMMKAKQAQQSQMQTALNSSMNQKKAYDSGAAIQKKDKKEDNKNISEMYSGMLNQLQNEKMRLSLLSQSRVQHQDSEVNRSQSIQFQNLVLDLEGIDQNDNLRYSTMNNQKPMQGIVNQQSQFDTNQQQVVGEIIKLKALMEKQPNVYTQTGQLGSIIKRYDNTQKHFLLLYFQELHNIVHGKDKGVDSQLLNLLSLLSNDIQKDSQSPAVLPTVQDNKQKPPEMKKNPIFEAKSVQLSAYDRSKQLEDQDSEVVGDSPKKNRHTNIFLGSRNKEIERNKRYNSTEANLPRGSYVDEKKGQRMTQHSQAESEIEQKIMDAQKNVDKELENRKKQLEKEQVLYFYDLCMKLRSDKQFGGSPFVNSVQIPALYEKCKQKKFMKEQFRDFIIAEFTRHIKLMSGEKVDVSEERDSHTFVHREKNLFQKRKNNNPHRGTHNVTSMNKIEVINERIDLEDYTDDEESKGKSNAKGFQNQKMSVQVSVQRMNQGRREEEGIIGVKQENPALKNTISRPQQQMQQQQQQQSLQQQQQIAAQKGTFQSSSLATNQARGRPPSKYK